MSIVVLNAGSSSLKFAVFEADGQTRRLNGHIDGVGEDTQLTLTHDGAPVTRSIANARDQDQAVIAALDILGSEIAEPVTAVGHRIVHGGTRFAEPVRLSEDVLVALQALIPLAPLHQPHNLAGVRAAQTAFPDAVQIGCFDTAFHRSHAWVNDAFALPRQYYDQGVRRYGFHGLSYQWLNQQLQTLSETRRPEKVVYAHLGAGASLCAVKAGRSVDTTMGFSALDGLPMATRSGQIDPGVLLHLMQTEHMDHTALTDLLYKHSGLKALSDLSGDMRVLQSSNCPKAAEAIAYFVFRCQREIAALAGVLEGLDALVFAGGVGENSAFVRAKICEKLHWLGVDIDTIRNEEKNGQAACISPPHAPVAVWIIPTDEEAVIAQAAARLLD